MRYIITLHGGFKNGQGLGERSYGFNAEAFAVAFYSWALTQPDMFQRITVEEDKTAKNETSNLICAHINERN